MRVFVFEREAMAKAGAQSYLCGSQVGPRLQSLPAGHTATLGNPSRVGASGAAASTGGSSIYTLQQTSDPKVL